MIRIIENVLSTYCVIFISAHKEYRNEMDLVTRFQTKLSIRLC